MSASGWIRVVIPGSGRVKASKWSPFTTLVQTAFYNRTKLATIYRLCIRGWQTFCTAMQFQRSSKTCYVGRSPRNSCWPSTSCDNM